MCLPISKQVRFLGLERDPEVGPVRSPVTSFRTRKSAVLYALRVLKATYSCEAAARSVVATKPRVVSSAEGAGGAGGGGGVLEEGRRPVLLHHRQRVRGGRNM